MAIFTNQATLRYNNITRNSNIATGEIVQALTLSKEAISDEYFPTDDITYALSVVNTGVSELTNLTLVDNLGAYMLGTNTLYPLTYKDGSLKYYVNGVLQPTPATTTSPALTITGITLPAGANAMFIYETTANEFAPISLGSSITNTASLQSSGTTPAITASETVTVRAVSDLTISKSVSPSVINENGLLTYTLVIQNTGNAATSGNATVTDTFLPRLENVVVTYNGEEWTEGINYTYNELTGEFATLDGQISVDGAVFVQDSVTGEITSTPGVAVITVTGNVV